MSAEKPCTSGSASKKSKDKNSSTATEALHDCKHKAKSNGTSCSEKDSGFSDNSSDSKHTNEKDDCNKKQQRETKEELRLNHNEPRKKSNHRNVIVAPAPQQLPSLYIIKNSVQPNIVQKNAQVLWSSGAMPSVSGSNPIILLQPSTSPLFPKSSGKSNSDVTTDKTKAANLPGSSYPHIAPRPQKKTAGKPTSNGDHLNQSKRICIESNDAQANGNSQGAHGAGPSTEQASSSNVSVLLTQPTSTVSTITTSELNKSSIINTRHRRLFNTAQALKKSGLWDMTLRTKKLMRQSHATQRDIAQLRQHSDLLHQLTGSFTNQNNQKAVWHDLHKVMAESGSYPDLKDIQELHVPVTQQEAEVAGPTRDENGQDGDDHADPSPQQRSKSQDDEPKEAARDCSGDD